MGLQAGMLIVTDGLQQANFFDSLQQRAQQHSKQARMQTGQEATKSHS